MNNNDSILMAIMFTIALIVGCLLAACSDFGRYEVALNGVTGKPCYIKDYKTGEELPVTKALLEKVDGSFYCDPSLCE